MSASLSCPICAGSAVPHDVVDFNKSCAESWGTFLPLCGTPIYYYLCEGCGFCFAPEFRHWSPQDFAERIYNEGYGTVDPDYAGARSRGNAELLEKLFGDCREEIRHLDYGGGAGLLSDVLSRRGWESVSCDPFVNPADVRELGTFDLITAFEVFEHSPDIPGLLGELRSLLSPSSLMLISTLLSDGEVAMHKRLTWWYASPRNGHISLFSRNSLVRGLARIGLTLESKSPDMHFAFESVPGWASHLLPGA